MYILASASIRREELLKEIINEFEIIPSNIEEKIDKSLTPIKNCEIITLNKALDIYKKYPNKIIIASDTIVVKNTEILQKPINFKEAFNTLMKLNDQTHNVYTCMIIKSKEIQEIIISKTEVTFKKLTEEQLRNYILEFKPFDKAGSYGIQDNVLVKSIKGEYNTVLGLDIQKLKKYLKKNKL